MNNHSLAHYSTKINHSKIEETLFAFTMQIATIQDFEFYLKTYKKSLFFLTNQLSKITYYFKSNYQKGFRAYAERILNQNAPHLLNELDSIFCPKSSPKELLNIIKHNYCSGIYNTQTLLTIEYNINNIFEIHYKHTDSIPGELLFYLYILSTIQTNQQCYIEHSKQILKQLQNSVNILKLIDLHSDIELHSINREIIITILFDLHRKNFVNDLQYIMLILILKKITFPINEEQLILQIQCVFKESDRLLINIFLNVSALQVYLDYFKGITLKNNKLYFEIFRMTIEKIGDQLENEQRVALLKWIISKITLHNIHISDYNKLFRFEMSNYLILCLTDNHFASHILPLLLIQLVSQSFQGNNLVEYYRLFNKVITQINLNDNIQMCPFELKLSLFYIQLAQMMYKKQILIANIKKITLNKHDVNNFDVHFVFMYLHSDLRNTMRERNSFCKLIEEIEERTGLNFNLIDMLWMNYNQINNALKLNAIYYEEDFVKSNIGSSKQLCNKIKEILNNEEPYIIYINLNKSILSKLNNDWCFKNKLIHNTILNRHKKEIGCDYLFQGFFIINSNNTKHIYLYEETSQCWYNLTEQLWISNIVFNNKTIKCIRMVYFYKRKSKENQIINIKTQFKDINAVHKRKEYDLYWDVFFNILELNPSLINLHVHIFCEWLDLGNAKNFKKVVDFIERKHTLNSYAHDNIEIKKLLLGIIEYIHTVTKDNNEQTFINEIEKKCYFMNPYVFVNELKSFMECQNRKYFKGYKYNQIIWNIKYYLQHLNSIKNINHMLVLLITFVCLISLSSLSQITKTFWFEKLVLVKIISSFNIEMLNYLKQSLLDCPLESFFQNISLFLKDKTEIPLVEDSKMKFLCELMLFSKDIVNYISTTNQNELCCHLERLIINNKSFINFRQTNQIIIRMLYEIIKQNFKEDNALYTELIRICFESLQEENVLNLNALQIEVFSDYFVYLKRKEVINNNEDIIMTKLKYFSKCIFEYQQLPTFFAELLLLLKDRKDSFDKKLKPLLLNLYEYSSFYQTNHDLQFSIVYYLFYCKIQREKSKIEKTNFVKYLHRPHFIFAFMNKHIKSLLKEITKNNSNNNNIVCQLYNDFNKKNNIQLNSYFDINLQDYFATNIIASDIELIENTFHRKCFLIKNMKNINNYNNNNSSMIPNELINQDIAPFMIYVYDHPCNPVNNEMYHLKKKYILKGIVCKFKAKSIMLIKNEYNSYWYSVTEQLWVDCVDLYVKQSEDVVKVYYLFENTTKYNLKFDDLQIYSSNKIKSSVFYSHIHDDMKWLLTNAIWIVLDIPWCFVYIFGLNGKKQKEELLKIKVPWKENKYQQFLSNIDLHLVNMFGDTLL